MLFLLLVLSDSHLSAQQAPIAPSTRDTQAVGVLQKAIAVLGGPAASQVQSVIVRGTNTPTAGQDSASVNVTYEDQFSTQGHEFRDQFQTASTNQTFVSGHGSPGLVSGSRTTRFLQHMADFRFPTHLPVFVLIQAMANVNVSLDYVGPCVARGANAVKIHVHNDSDAIQQALSIQDWYFDATSGLPLRVEYRLHDAGNALYYMSAAVEFSDFRMVQGVVFPFQVSSFLDGTLRGTLTLSSFTLNPTVASSDFDIPTVVAQ
jgi:hypothetical protein